MILKKKKLKSDDISASPAVISITSSVFAIVLGLVFGLLLLLVIDPTSAMYGFATLVSQGFSSGENFGKLLYNAAPLIMTGLAVGFAFKVGLFNIGATGQYTVGAIFALYAAIVLQFPWWAAILVAMVAGAIWGFFPGFFKAMFNVNEVITSIMFNWVGVFFVQLFYYNTPALQGSPANQSVSLAFSNPNAILPNLGLNTSSLLGSFFNIGFLVAIVFAVIAYIIMNKTTFGYELKACGLNRNASTYAGINAKRNIVLSMMIAGGFAGIGGGIMYLSGTVPYTSTVLLNPMGFNGIPVALLASSHPLGIIASSLFIALIQVGGPQMQPEYSSEIVNIVLAVIIYFSAFAFIMRNFVVKILYTKKQKAKKITIPDVSAEVSGKEVTKP
ncbi:MAG: ABC transporter permease [Candidatus Izemoplasmatales bacterium]|jgi:simple sugar transport system permease protein|nr:ABC transporter permease [Candidatus Izemoplasmatales bacterium]